MARVHRVQHGECLSSIAADCGFFPATIWDHDNNAELRERRDPNVLHVGDELFIPDHTIKTEPGSLDQRHVFKRKGVPAQLRVQLCNGLEPRAQLRFSLVVDGWQTTQGQTDDDGVLEVSISPQAQHGVLTLADNEQVIHLSLGELAPIETDEGLNQRLFNLGVLRRPRPSRVDRRAAIKMFQRCFGLEASGEVDDATRAKLVEIHETRETD